MHAPFAHTTPLCTSFDLANASAGMGGVANSGHVKANGPRRGPASGKDVVIMKLLLKDEKYTFTVTKAAEPKTEFGSGKQKMNRAPQLPEWVMEILGHSQISMTSKYAHVLPQVMTDAAERIGRALWGDS